MEAIIIGGGIGGLCTAIALQNSGISVKLFEASVEIRSSGAGLWLAPNALQAFGRLDLEREILAKGFPLRHISILDGNGRLIQDMDCSSMISHYGFPFVAITRPGLFEVLKSRLDPGSLRTGMKFLRFEQSGNRVRVYFEGGESDSADLLLGADGINSQVRRQLYPDSHLRYTGQSCWRGISNHRLDDSLTGRGREIWNRGLRFGFSQVENEKVYWYAVRNLPPSTPSEPSAWKDEIINLFGNFSRTVESLIEFTDISSITRVDLCDLPPLRSWIFGRVALLGDAAHAMTPNLGQGACQAIEDAVALALSLTTQRDVTPAFRMYQKMRKPKAARIVRQSWRMGRAASWENGLLCVIRNFILRNAPVSLQNREMNKLYRLQF